MLIDFILSKIKQSYCTLSEKFERVVTFLLHTNNRSEMKTIHSNNENNPNAEAATELSNRLNSDNPFVGVHRDSVVNRENQQSIAQVLKDLYRGTSLEEAMQRHMNM